MPFIRRIGFVPYALVGVVLALLRPTAAPRWENWVLYLLAGVGAGIVLVPVAALVVGTPVSSALQGFVRAPRRLFDAPHAWLLVSHYTVVAVAEELFYRVGLQAALLGDGVWAIALVSALFAAFHQIGRREIVVVNVLELVAFSCLLGFAYATTRSLALVVGIHALRDIGVVLLREKDRR